MLPRLRMRLREVYQSVPRRYPLKENVLGHRKVGDEVALLVDDGDACSDRIPGRAENEVSIFEFERPAVGPVNPGDDLDQGRLACAILTMRMRLIQTAARINEPSRNVTQ